MDEEKVVEKFDPLAPIDYIFEDILGLPGPGTVLKTLAPAEVADTLGIPTPAEIATATYDKMKERFAEKVR